MMRLISIVIACAAGMALGDMALAAGRGDLAHVATDLPGFAALAVTAWFCDRRAEKAG